jgi:NAD(P)-dependent dehydrogenase (short-subunit alcohol dehydrogenase family)
MGVLDGRVAIITGAGRGIGASIARAFAREGASLVINDLGAAPDGTAADQSLAHAVAEELNGIGGKVVADAGDIADVETGQRLVETAVGTFGKLDILVNVAGILRDRMIFNMPEEDWDAVIRVHLKGHFSTIKPAAQYFRGQRNPNGHFRIINFSSLSGLQGSPGQPNYAAAKLGIVGFTYSLAQGLGRYGVTANAISPSAATRLTETVPSEKQIRKADPASPERSPDNIAPVALYLASERSDWLSGRTLGAGGYEVTLYNNPEPIRQIQGNAPWEFDRLADSLEKSFQPVATGLPFSLFASQIAS